MRRGPVAHPVRHLTSILSARTSGAEARGVSAVRAVLLGAAVVVLLAPSAVASCLTGSIGDNDPRALDRYLHCKEMESRVEDLERAEQARANAERQQQETERDRRCIAISKTTDQYFDCVQAGRPKVTKEQFEDARRHLFPESQTPEFEVRVRDCVQEQARLMREYLDKKRATPPPKDSPACSGLTPAERLDATMRSGQEFTEIMKHRAASERR